MITGTKLTLSFPHEDTQRVVLNGIDFTIPKGRITAFIGRSGAGKTSLLRCCAHLTTGYQGTITLQGKPLAAYTDRARIHTVGFVFQRFNLFPHMTVLQNCTAPVLYEGTIGEKEANKKAHELLILVGMDEFANRLPHQLSGGQQQRVAIARALMLNPRVLLFDEPTSALDPESTGMLGDVLHTLVEQGITIAYASHDMQFIAATRDRVYLLENGKVAEFFDQQEHQISDTPQIQAFLSSEVVQER